MHEQRQHQRRDLIASASIANPAGNAWSAVGMLDISISGASFKTTERVIVDTLRLFNFTLPENPLEIHATVKIVNRAASGDAFRVGITFVKIDPASVELITRYVQADH